jgi:hypothetical protein
MDPNARGEFKPGCMRGTYHAPRVHSFSESPRLPNENNKHGEEFTTPALL